MENSSLYGLIDTLRTKKKNNKHDRKSNNTSIKID